MSIRLLVPLSVLLVAIPALGDEAGGLDTSFGGTGKVTAYGSMIDQLTQDPTFVPPL